MRRTCRSLTVVVGVVVAALVAGACGVAADDTAATVGDQTITTQTVDSLTRNADYVRAVLGGTPTTDESTLPGDDARATLLLEIQRAALENEAERWGVPITDALRRDAREQVRGQLVQNDLDEVGPEVEDRLVDFVAARVAMDERLSDLDPGSEQDLRALYDGAPALFRRTCVLVISVDPGGRARAARLVDQGVPLRRLPARLDVARLVADPEQSCLPIEQLTGRLGQAVARRQAQGRTGQVFGPVTLADGTSYFFRIDGSERISFRAAQDDLRSVARALVEQGVSPWIGLVLLRGVEINPRYGAGIGLDAQGGLTVVPPQRPPATAAELLSSLGS